MNEAKRLGGEALSTIPGGDRVQVQQLPSYSDIDGVLEEIQTLKGNMTRKAKILRDLGLPVSE